MAIYLSSEPLEADLGRGVTLIDPLRNHRWDRFVHAHPYGWITHLSGWKRVLDKNFPHMCGYYLAFTTPDGDIKAALPIYAVRSWLTGRRLVSIPFATLCDPLVSDPSEMEILCDAVLRLAEHLQISRIEIRTAQAPHLLDREKFRTDCGLKHHFIRLSRDPEEVRMRFHRSCVRQRILRAERSGLNIIRGRRETDLMDFYLLHRGMRRKKGLPPQPYALVKSLWQTFSGQGLGELLLCRKGAETVAGVLLFNYKGRVSIEYSAMNTDHISCSPLHFLLWSIIKDACRAGYQRFDFGQTKEHNKSLMDFKSHWGTEILDLPHFLYPNDSEPPCPIYDRSLARKALHYLCNKAPDTALSYLGEFCYRHMG